MPLYEYRCGACGHADTEFQHIHEDRLTQCPQCGESAYKRQVSQTTTTQKEFGANLSKPIEMYSIAMEHPAEIRAFQRKAPDVDVSTDPKDPLYGVPIARTRHQKHQALAAADFEERN